MEPLGTVGGWDFACDGGRPHENTLEYFWEAARIAWRSLTNGVAHALGLRPEHIQGSLTLMPYDTEPNHGSAGWYRHSDDKAVVLYRRETRTRGGSDPAMHYGVLPQSSVVTSIVHEMAHRTWYRLHPASRAFWAEFVYTLDTAFSDEELLGMARRAEVSYMAEGGARTLTVAPRDLLRASVQLGRAQAVMADTFWWWYHDEHPQATPLDYLKWLRSEKYSKILPTNYAKRAPVESWPEVVADLVLYGSKLPRTTHRLLACVVTWILREDGDGLEVAEQEESAPDRHVVSEVLILGRSPLERARARVLQLGG